MTPSQAIAQWLRGYVAEHRITHSELARRVDMPQQKFSRKMNGKTPFTIDELSTVVDALGIDYAGMVNEIARRIDEQKSLRLPEQPSVGEHQLGDGAPALDIGKPGVTLRAQQQPEQAPGPRSTRQPRGTDSSR